MTPETMNVWRVDSFSYEVATDYIPNVVAPARRVFNMGGHLVCECVAFTWMGTCQHVVRVQTFVRWGR